MSLKNKKNVAKEDIASAIAEHKTMGGAAISLGLDRRTFAKIAKEYDLYDGKSNRTGGTGFLLEDILNGQHPQYPTSKLSKRLVKTGLKQYCCESCGISEYNNAPISLELNHKDGNSGNHALENLELLCPNCHSQTDTYRSKKIKKLRLGSVVEWSIAPHLKCGESKGSVGSNPTASATKITE